MITVSILFFFFSGGVWVLPIFKVLGDLFVLLNLLRFEYLTFFSTLIFCGVLYSILESLYLLLKEPVGILPVYFLTNDFESMVYWLSLSWRWIWDFVSLSGSFFFLMK